MSASSPFSQDLATLRNALDQLWGEGFGGQLRGSWTRPNGATYAPVPLDVYATRDAFVILAAVPGMRRDDLEVTYNQGTILLSGVIGNVAETEEAKGATWYVHELWHGRFQRAITPPFEVDADNAQAHYQDGILRIRLPKAEHAKPRRIEVRMGGDKAPAIETSGAPQAEPATTSEGEQA
jgi:HSP20 family protein